ncbi:MAG TPA: hypothetical protein VGI82_06045 [Chitinophagaceae bacterium]
MRIITLLALLVTMFSSCYSYKIYPKEYRSFKYEGEKEKAFIINPELSKEYRILKRSGIFQITNDSLDDSVVKIRLYPFERFYGCAEPVLLGLFTLGQFPVLLPDTYWFTFEETKRSNTVKRRFQLGIATRYWFWDIFAFNKKFDQKAGQTLLASYYNN